MEFSRQEYWSGLLFPSPGDLPDPGIEPTSLCLQHWQAGSITQAPPMLVSTRKFPEKFKMGSYKTV